MALRKLIGIVFVGLFIMSSLTAFAENNDNGINRQVLILHSYHKGLAWTDDFQRGIEEILKADNVELFVEYMDGYRSEEKGYYKILYDYYREKFHDKKWDVILVTDNFAYDFMKQYHDSLFLDVPIVFGGINNYSPDDLINNNTTGIAQSSTQKTMVDLILKLHPNVETIIIAGGVSATALAESEGMIELGKKEFQNIEFKSVITDTLEEQLMELKKFDKNTVIIAAGTMKDEKGNFLDHSTFSSKIIDHTGFPVYALAKCYIEDYGAIGGAAVDSYIHGRIVAGFANRILGGERTQNIKTIENPIWSYTFDYFRLKEFKIDQSLIPSSAVILNSPEDNLVIDKTYARLILMTMAAMAILIIGFLINNRKRKNAEKVTLETKNKLRQNNMELETNNQFLKESKEKLNKQFYELSEKNERIEFLAYYDPLTKLMNRNKFCEVLKDLLPNRQRVVIYTMHLKNIKTINDTYGHEIGNKCILMLSNILNAILDKKNYVFGIHHNEYLIADLYAETEAEAIRNVEYLLDRVCRTFKINNHDIEIKVNIGIAIYPEHGRDYDTLLKYSNLAMIEARKNGKNTYCVYNDELYTRVIDELEMEKQLKRALFNQEFLLYYQPKIDVKHGEIIGLEALIRWRYPDGSIVFPDKFIEIAERKGLINQIGDWVLFEACRQIKEWESMGISLCVSVNVSAKQLTGTHLLKKVEEAIRTNQINPSLLEIEITETSMMNNLKGNIELLSDLRDLKIGIALDDFGTGYSSMNYIKELPITKIKIDKSFIDRMEDDAHREIVNSMVVLGHAFGFIVNAEGIETSEELKVLREYGVDELQGFLFSRALPREQIPEFIKASKERIKAIFEASF